MCGGAHYRMKSEHDTRHAFPSWTGIFRGVIHAFHAQRTMKIGAARITHQGRGQLFSRETSMGVGAHHRMKIW
jgi:hypothetical protein